MDFEEEGSFGDLLARYRTLIRRSQQQLATCLGVHRSTIVKWEQKGSLPRDRTRIEEIARCLKLTEHQRDALLRAALLDISHLIWNIPYPRNPFFTGRGQELEHLHAQLQQRTTAAVGQTQSINGLGGIGKTQLAVEYAYRYGNEYEYVLWARAESVEVLTSSFTELSRLLDLPEKDAQGQEITIQAIKRWLQRQHGWLLILDNADTPGLLPAFLPPTVGGHLLITTRAADLSGQITGLAHPLMVETFSEELGALFLLHRSGLIAPDATLVQAEASTQQLAREISRELGGLPLALDQAGAYLKTTGSSLAAYQQIYQRHHTQLLKERRGADHPEPVATTWDISFSKVEQQNPAAADLLRLCAFLAPDTIPETVITKGAEELGPVLAPVTADAYLLNQAIETLRAYSLIVRDPQAQMLTVHRLVQAVLRESLAGETRKQWAERAMLAVNAASPDVTDVEQWESCEHWLPHALICAVWIKQEQFKHAESGWLLYKAGYYLDDRGRYGEAEPLLRSALSIWEQQLGSKHPLTITLCNNLAHLYRNQGKYAEAESLYRWVLGIWEHLLGPKHPEVATSLIGLANVYCEQGKHMEGEPLFQNALRIREQQLGPEHPEVAEPLIGLANIYQVQGKHAEAEPLYKRALRILEQRLGPEHPEVAYPLIDLAALYLELGKYAEAESLYRRTLHIQEQTLGPEHPNMPYPLTGLANIYCEQGKYEEAEPLYQRALGIWERELGPEHPNVAYPLTGLATIYCEQGKYGEAEPLYRRALAIREQQLGATHPDTVSSFNSLAALYADQGKYGEARPGDP